MSAERIKELRALAEKATPGRREVSGDGAQVYVDGMIANCACQWANDDDDAGLEADDLRGRANANFIAACDPQTVLRLLDIAEAAVKARDILVRADIREDFRTHLWQGAIPLLDAALKEDA